jgi:exopolyphosphatase / guanosine-5'-triphosphate,3'-diphosphate pyrophosphatase
MHVVHGRRVSRCAAVDVGSNTAKLVVAERRGDGGFATLLDVSRTTRLGERIQSRRLAEPAMQRTLAVLQEYVGICRSMGVSDIAAVGTSALRDADNRQGFVSRAHDVGLAVEPIEGREEARLSYLAVRRDPLWRGAGSLVVVDIGGGSTEVIYGGAETIEARVSVPMGAVRLTEAALPSDPPTPTEIEAASRLAADALAALAPTGDRAGVVGVGGTFVNMAAVHLATADPASEDLHGSRLTELDVDAQIRLYSERTVAQRRSIVGLDPARADIILGGVLVLREVLRRLRFEALSVSCRGLRWGLLYDRFGDPEPAGARE